MAYALLAHGNLLQNKIGFAIKQLKMDVAKELDKGFLIIAFVINLIIDLGS